MSRYHRLTEIQRREIAMKYKRGYTIATLAAQYNVSPKTIRKWANRHGHADRKFKDLPRKHRTSVVSKQQRQRIRQSALKGKTVADIAKSIDGKTGEQPSISSVRRVLTKGKAPLQYLPIKRGRVLSAKNKQARIDFCQKHSNSQVGSWVFGDAKTYHMYKCSCGYSHYAWQHLDDEVHIKLGTVSDTFTFYAFVGKGVKSKLIFTDPTPPARSKQHTSNTTFNSTSFMRVIDQAVQYLTIPQGSRKRRVVVLDRAKQHTSKASSDHLTKCGVHVLESFPAQSWDINVIENAWGILDTKLLGVRARTSRGWRKAIETAWDHVSQRSINKLVDEVKDRMAEIINQDGAWLSMRG